MGLVTVVQAANRHVLYCTAQSELNMGAATHTDRVPWGWSNPGMAVQTQGLQPLQGLYKGSNSHKEPWGCMPPGSSGMPRERDGGHLGIG